MYNLLYKDLRLAAHPTLYVFTLLGAMVIIPAYPYTVVFLYGILAPYITFMYGRETNDIYYSALLPIKKSDIVTSKTLLMVLCQAAQILFSVPFAVLRARFIGTANPVGIETNVAYYGFGLCIFGLFNLVFLSQFFKTAYKAGRAFILASIPAVLAMVATEASVHLPFFAWLDENTPSANLRQLPILLAGLLLYAGATLLGHKLATRRFARVDL